MARLISKELEGVRIEGFSLAGEETVVAAPEYNVCFDIGRAPREVVSIDNICLTHGHMDHAAGIAYYFSQRIFVGNSPGRVIVHYELVDPINELMEVWARIERHPSPHTVLGVQPLVDVPLRRDLLVRPFSVRHTPESLGFTLIETRHKLKAKFHGKSGPQLVALKREGVTIEERFEVPIVTCTGDTATGQWMDHDFVRQSRVVLLECTFFDRDHVMRARAGKHIHVVDLPEVLSAIPEARILLYHVTRRTDLRSAKEILRRAVSSSDFERITFLMDRPPRNPNARRDRDIREPIRERSA